MINNLSLQQLASAPSLSGRVLSVEGIERAEEASCPRGAPVRWEGSGQTPHCDECEDTHSVFLEWKGEASDFVCEGAGHPEETTR